LNIFLQKQEKMLANHFTSILVIVICGRLFRLERKQSHHSGSFDGGGQLSLVFGTHATHTARDDFAFLGHKFAETTHIFVVNIVFANRFVGTIQANFAFLRTANFFDHLVIPILGGSKFAIAIKIIFSVVSHR